MGMLRSRGWRLVGSVALAATLTAAGCANDTDTASTPTTSAGSGNERTTTAAEATTTAPERSCDQEPTMSPVEAAPVAAIRSDVDVTSFDGTTIRLHWFPAPGDGPHPTILMGPG